MLKRLVVVVTLVVLAGFTVQSSTVQAETTKIGVMNVQKIINESAAGKNGLVVVEKRTEELKTKFKAEQDALVELQKEIEKKNSAWSEDKKAEKSREFQLKQREMQVKLEDAQMEIEQLKAKEVNPVLKTLETVIKEFGEKEGYSVILGATPREGVFYFTPAVDVTDAVIKEIDSRLKK